MYLYIFNSFSIINNILFIALWSTILLSLMFAATSFMMFVFSNYNCSMPPIIKDYAIHNAEFTTSQLAESVRVEATHHAAKIIVTRKLIIIASFTFSHCRKRRFQCNTDATFSKVFIYIYTVKNKKQINELLAP